MSGLADLLVPCLDDGSAAPLYRRLYLALRQMIIAGALRQRLPSTRRLASQLGISRNSVAAAYDLLQSEGYLTGRRGSGSFVAAALPDQPPLSAASAPAPAPSPRRLGRLAAILPDAHDDDPPDRPFHSGAQAFADFPWPLWGRLLARPWRRPQAVLIERQDPAGLPALRCAIADLLAATRAMRCDPAQILVTGGSQQALDIACRLLLDPGDRVMVEDPGFRGSLAAVTAAGGVIRPQPVDDEGLRLPADLTGVQAVLVTPSRNFPLGRILSLPRRLALLQAAADAGAWIVEDDFDAEFRFAGRPLASLFGMDRHDQVLYAGTFSRTMFPALRLGYLVLPPTLVAAGRAVRLAIDGGEATPLQAAVAAFIAEGHYAAQLRRRRVQLAAARDALVAALRRHAGDRLDIVPADGGLSLTALFRQPTDDIAVAGRLAAAGIVARPLSPFYRGADRRQGLVLGFAGWSGEQLEEAVRRMAGLLE